MTAFNFVRTFVVIICTLKHQSPMNDTHFVISAHRGNITGPFSDLTWTQARDYCEQQGLKLLTIDSQEEEDVAGTINPVSR